MAPNSGDDSPARRAVRAVFGLALPLGIFALLASVYVPWGELETDEGFYGLAARAAIRGGIPYRDFPFNQTHLFPYLQGALLSLTGFGLFAHRALCALYAALAIALLGAAAQVRARAFSFGLLAWALAASPCYAYRSLIGKSFSMTALFLAGAGAASLWMAPRARRTWAIAALGAAAVGCKLTVLPVAGLLWAYELWRTRRPLAVLAPAASLAVLFGPVIAADPGAWWFWNVGYHLGMRAIDFRTLAAYRDHLAMAPAVVALALAAIVLARRRGAQGGAAAAPGISPAAAVLGAALVGWAFQLPLRSTQGHYAVIFLPAVALGAAELLAASALSLRARVALCAAPLLVLLFPFPRIDRKLGAELNAAAELLRERVPMDRPLLTPLPVIALQSGHPVLPGLENGPFCITSELDADRARRLHLPTPESLRRAVEEGIPGAVVLTTQPSTWDFYWSVPSLDPVPPPERAELFRAISEAGFHPVLRNGEFTVMLPDRTAPPSPPFWAEPPRG